MPTKRYPKRKIRLFLSKKGTINRFFYPLKSSIPIKAQINNGNHEEIYGFRWSKRRR